MKSLCCNPNCAHMEIDSGEFDPNGEPIIIPCEYCEKLLDIAKEGITRDVCRGLDVCRGTGTEEYIAWHIDLLVSLIIKGKPSRYE